MLSNGIVSNPKFARFIKSSILFGTVLGIDALTVGDNAFAMVRVAEYEDQLEGVFTKMHKAEQFIKSTSSTDTDRGLAMRLFLIEFLMNY